MAENDIDCMSRLPPPEPEVDRRGVNEEVDHRKAHESEYVSLEPTGVSPKVLEGSAGRDTEQAPGSGVIDLISQVRSMQDADTDRPLLTHTQAVGTQALPLPAGLLSTYKKQNGSHSHKTSLSDVSMNTEEGRSEFEILEVRDRTSSASEISGKSQDHVDAPTPTKYPKQVQDQQGSSFRYVDLLKGQFQLNQESGDKGITKVKAGQFPSYDELNNKPGLLFYSTEKNLPVGEVYVRRTPNKMIGHGGNGEVFELFLRGEIYALKMTRYRKSELNVWSKLVHPNILPLLGVMMGDQLLDCYQFMPLMTGNLGSMMSGHGDLYHQLKTNQKQWGMILCNTMFILTEILKGLVYLDQSNIQHSDLKADNILVKKSCLCYDLLHCGCPIADKFSIQISDFDSVKQTTSKRQADQFGKYVKDGMRHPKGTPAYRAPEQFTVCPKLNQFKKVLQDGKEYHDMEGPWCDMWSLGVIILKMTMGYQDNTYIEQANIISHHDAKKMDPHIEATAASLRLNHLYELLLDHSELSPLARMVSKCLKVNCAERSTASGMLDTLPPVQEASQQM